jgi:hypothetical protein
MIELKIESIYQRNEPENSEREVEDVEGDLLSLWAVRVHNLLFAAILIVKAFHINLKHDNEKIIASHKSFNKLLDEKNSGAAGGNLFQSYVM